MEETYVRDNLTARNFAIRTDQETMLIRIAKDEDRSVSGALRFILDDWVDMKKASLQAAVPDDKNVLSPMETPA